MRRLAGLVVMVLALACIIGPGRLFAGPGKPEQPPAQGTAQPAATGGDAVAGYAPKNKLYTFTWVGYQLTPLVEKPLVIEYWEKKLNVKINLINIEPQNYDEVLNLKFASGEIPDRIRIQQSANLARYVTQNVLAKIPTAALQAYAPAIWKYYNREDEAKDRLKYATINGSLFALPVYGMAAHLPMAWRGDWLKSVGVTGAPQTLADFESVLYKLTRNDPDRNGKNDTYGMSTEGIKQVYLAYNLIPVDITNPQGNAGGGWQLVNDRVVYSGIRPEMKEALQYLAKWYKDGVIDPEFVTGENQGGYWQISHPFVNGRIGMTGMCCWYHWPENDPGINKGTRWELNLASPQAAKDLVFGLPIIGPSGKRADDEPMNLTGVFHGFGVQLEKEPDRFGKMLQVNNAFVATYEDYNEAMYGPVGGIWDWKDATRTETVFKPGFDATKASANGGHVILIPIEPIEYGLRGMPQTRRDFFVNNEFGKYLLRNWIIKPLPSEQKYKTELDKLLQQSYLAIITGDKPLAYFDEFVAAWRKNGGDVLTQEANAAYDEEYRKK